MKKTDISIRLDALETKIKKAQHLLDARGRLVDDGKTGLTEIRDRYNILSNKIANEVGEIEKHGRHVTDLEQSVELWLESLDLDVS